MNYSEISRFFQPFTGWHFLIGFSGGADSTAALLTACRAAAPLGITVEAVHCEHGLRGDDSRADAVWCRDFCAARQIPFRCESLNVPANRAPGENLEQAARRLRLACWRRLTGGRPQTAVVLGHHRDDRRENLLLRLSRGSNASGAAGMRRISVVDGVTLLRPLLLTSRREIEAFLRRETVSGWRHDATNDDAANQRNFLRLELLPAWERRFPFAGAGLDRALEALEADAVYLESEAARAADAMPEPWRRDSFLALAIPIRNRVLQILLRRAIPSWPPAGGALLRRFNAMLERPTPEPRRLPIGGGRVLEFRGDTVALMETVPPVSRIWNWLEDEDPLFGVRSGTRMPDWRTVGVDRAFFDADRLPPQLRIVSGADGDVMEVFGGGRVKWKKLRIDRRISRRHALPLLRLPDDTIIWSPGIRHSGFAPVTSATARWVEFYLRKPLSHGGTIWQPPNN